VRMTSASVSSSEENHLSRRKTTWVPRRESGALGRRFEEQGEGRGGPDGVGIWVRARNTMNMRVL
jgi:hypothetical protein